MKIEKATTTGEALILAVQDFCDKVFEGLSKSKDEVTEMASKTFEEIFAIKGNRVEKDPRDLKETADMVFEIFRQISSDFIEVYVNEGNLTIYRTDEPKRPYITIATNNTVLQDLNNGPCILISPGDCWGTQVALTGHGVGTITNTKSKLGNKVITDTHTETVPFV